MTTPLRIDVGAQTDRVSVRLTGELTFHTALQLELAWAELVTKPPGPLTLDLAEVAFCDSVGIGTLVRVRIDAAAARWKVVLAHARPQLHELLTLAGVAEYLLVAADTGTEPEPLTVPL